MTEQLYDYDPAIALTSSESIAVFIADAFETRDSAYIAKALNVVVRAKGMMEMSRELVGATLRLPKD